MFFAALVHQVWSEEKNSVLLHARTVTIKLESEMKFLLYLPDGYESSNERFPLVLFLHGGGQSGDDVERVKEHGIPEEIVKDRKLPFIVLAPQNPYKWGLWDDRAMYAFLEMQLKELRVDRSRIYLAGLSRGGHGVFRLAAQHPNTFAAVAVVCGGGPITYAQWCKDTPFWFFHGDRDITVPTEESVRLSAAIRELGGKAKLTIYPETAHNRVINDPAQTELKRELATELDS